MVKNLPASAGDSGSIPGLGRSPGERNGNHSSALAWEIPLTEEPGGLQSMGSESDTTSQLNNKNREKQIKTLKRFLKYLPIWQILKV